MGGGGIDGADCVVLAGLWGKMFDCLVAGPCTVGLLETRPVSSLRLGLVVVLVGLVGAGVGRDEGAVLLLGGLFLFLRQQTYIWRTSDISSQGSKSVSSLSIPLSSSLEV